jgi:hypothetical protein
MYFRLQFQIQQKLRKGKQNIAWRCSNRNCPASVATNSDRTSLLSSSNNHRRIQLLHSDQLQGARICSCTRKAADDIGSRQSKVLRSCLAELDATMFDRSDLYKLTRRIQSMRN